MPDCIDQDVLFFFDGRKWELALWEGLAERLLARYPCAQIRVKKTQIGFYDPGLFACVSFTPVRRKAERPDPFLTVTFSLDRPPDHPRVLAVPIRPGRWTCHVLLGGPEDIDDVLLGWLEASHALADERKKRHAGN